MNKEEEAELKKKMDILWRGAYGDKPNEITGWVDEIKFVKKSKRYKDMVIGGLLVLQSIYFIIKEFHIKLF